MTYATYLPHHMTMTPALRAMTANRSRELDAYYRVEAAKKAYAQSEWGYRTGHWKDLKQARTEAIKLGDPQPRITVGQPQTKLVDMVV